jgi:hypothetical protein
MNKPRLQFYFRDAASRGAADELAWFLAHELPDLQAAKDRSACGRVNLSVVMPPQSEGQGC